MSALSVPETGSDNSGAARITSVKNTELTDADKVRRWKEEIAQAELEQKTWHDRGVKIVKRYVDDRTGMIDDLDKKFNLFTTNVGIMQADAQLGLTHRQVFDSSQMAVIEQIHLIYMPRQNCLIEPGMHR